VIIGRRSWYLLGAIFAAFVMAIAFVIAVHARTGR
jgi:hypothetical protein